MKDSERETLYKVRDAAFANPFDHKRLDIDLAITGLSPQDPVKKVGAQLLEKVTQTTNAVTARNHKKQQQTNNQQAAKSQNRCEKNEFTGFQIKLYNGLIGSLVHMVADIVNYLHNLGLFEKSSLSYSS